MLWPAATTLNNIMNILLMFLTYIATGGYGIAVATAGMIATYSRAFDAISDPIIALFVDRLNPKNGKVRIVMWLGLTIRILSILTLFVWGIGRGMIFYIIVYMIYFIGSTIMNVAMNTGHTIITNDPSQRPKVFRWSMVYITVIGAFTSLYLSNVLFAKYGEISVPALQELCYTVTALSIVLGILATIAISEKDIAENFPKKADGKSIGIKETWQLLKDNKALQALLVAGVSDKLALQAAGQSAINIMVYGIIIGNYSFYGIFNMINLIPTLAIIFLATGFAGREGSKKALVRWTNIGMALAISIVVFLVVIDPTKVSVSTIPTAIFIILVSGFTAASRATATCVNAMRPDIVDYELYRSGNHMPGTVSAAYSFVDKFVSSFATTIVGFSLAAIGYVSVQPQPGDPATTAVFWVAMFLWMGLPILGYICTLVAMKFYPLDKEMMEEIQLRNQQSRKAQI